jgi:hypothetical protein
MFLVNLNGIVFLLLTIITFYIFNVQVNEHVVLLMVHYFDVITAEVTNTVRLN